MKLSQRWIDLGQILGLTTGAIVSVKGVYMRQDVPRYISAFTLVFCSIFLVCKVWSLRAGR
jgi:hypothetical protein